MQFISPLFLCFLPVVLALYYVTKPAFRWLVLLLSSLLFIGILKPEALIVLVSFSAFTFYSGKLIQAGRKYRTFIFYSALVVQSLSLILLKYMESEQGVLKLVFEEEGYRADVILLAAGFSFYTLQHMAYLADIYYDRVQADTKPLRFLLFSSFFAKFNSGPLEKAETLIAQFDRPPVSETLFLQGVQRIVLGFFKKMVLADRLAPIVSRAFTAQAHHGSLAVATSVCLFTVQLYFDFSAYSDIAIGTAKLFGIELSENFDRPFASLSVSEFWRRWHITLIRWFSNYIYYPLVYHFRKNGKLAVITAIFATFLISGLWHGIGKTFLIWSLLHAFYLSFESLTKNARLKWRHSVPATFYRAFSILTTFLLVCFSNLFFRSADMHQAKQLLTQLCSSPFGDQGFMNGFVSALAGGGYQEALFNFSVTVFLVLSFLFLEKKILARANAGNRGYLQLFILLVLIFTFGVFKNASYFIYMQF